MRGVVGFESGAGGVLFDAEGVEAAVGFEGSPGRWVGEVERGGRRGHWRVGVLFEVSRCGLLKAGDLFQGEGWWV